MTHPTSPTLWTFQAWGIPKTDKEGEIRGRGHFWVVYEDWGSLVYHTIPCERVCGQGRNESVGDWLAEVRAKKRLLQIKISFYPLTSLRTGWAADCFSVE